VKKKGTFTRPNFDWKKGWVYREETVIGGRAGWAQKWTTSLLVHVGGAFS